MKATPPFIKIFLFVLLFLANTSRVRAQQSVVVDSTILMQDTVQVVEDGVKEEETSRDPFLDHTGQQSSVTPRRLSQGRLKEIKSEKRYWFADSAFAKKPKSGYGMPFFMKGWVKAVFWILVVGGFAIALAFYLYYNNFRLFRKKDIPVKTEESFDLPENLFDIDFEKELKKALAGNDHRLAVRLQFLSLLRSLSEKSLIQYRQDRTNMDYIFQLGGKPFYAEFFRVVRHYEYSWYGRFEVSRENYMLIDSDFQKLLQKLN